MLCAHTWHVDEILPELEKLELADIKPYAQAVLKRSVVHLECAPVLPDGNFESWI
jgi:hypothetical protein